MSTRRFTTRVAPWAVLAVAAIGSPLITSQAAQATGATALRDPAPACYTVDDTAKTFTFTKDCSIFEGILVPDGWTVDGGGHTLTAVQDTEHPSFSSAIIQSAAGTDEAAASLNVHDLTIKTQGFETPGGTTDGSLAGIYLNRAGGTITNVEIDGVSHGNGGQEGYGVLARNYVTTSNLDVPRANLTVSDVKLTNYEKSGVKIDGNIAFTADHLDVGAAGAADGTPLTALAANAFTIVRGAHGSLTDSTIGENRYSTDDDEESADDHTTATAVLLYDAGRVDLHRNVISGTDGDTGIAIDSYSNTINTIASVTCNSITRTDGGNADAVFGAGIYNDNPSTDAVKLTVGSNTFSGWTKDVDGVFTTTSDPSCTTSTTAALSKDQVVAGNPVRVSGVVRNGDGTPAADGSVALLKKASGEKIYTELEHKAIAGNGGYSFTATPEKGTNYKATFTGTTSTESTSPVRFVYVSPAVSIKASPKSLKKGRTAHFTGKSSPALGGTKVTLTRYYGHAWHTVKTSKLSAKGAYALTWKATSKGNPTFRVRVEKAPGFLKGYSSNVTLKVS